MAYTNILTSYQFYSSPKMYCNVSYENQRDGADVKYRFSWKVWLASTSYYNDGLQMQVFLNGTQHNVSVKGTTSGKGWSFSGITEWYTVANKTTGTTPFYIRLKNVISGNILNTSKVNNLTIPAYQATISSAPDFNNTQNPTIKYINALGSQVTSLKACISFTGAAADIPYRDIPTTSGSYTFTLTTSERNTLINAVPSNKTSITLYFYLQTEIDGEYRKYRLQKTFSLVNSQPIINSITITDINPETLLVTEDEDTLVKYVSKAHIVIDAEPQNGANLSSYKVVCGDNQRTTATSNITEVESGTFNITVVDSRGLSTSQTVNKALINYIKPSCDINTEVTNPAEGIISYNCNFNGFTGSFGAVTNVLRKYIQYKEENAEEWTTVQLSQNSGTLELDYTKSYQIMAYCQDSLGVFTASSSLQVITFMPSFYWDKDNFYFNQNVFIKGNKVYVPKIESGVVLITPSGADTPTNYSITFNNNYSSTPVVVATAHSGGAYTYVREVTVTNVSTSGCDIVLTRKDTTATSVYYIVMENTAILEGD